LIPGTGGKNNFVFFACPVLFFHSGGPAFEMYTENLASENFEIRFSPGIAKEALAQPGDPVKGGVGFFTIAFFVILGLLLGWFLFKLDVISFRGGERERRMLKWRRRF
jgi:hypothetical protein